MAEEDEQPQEGAQEWVEQVEGQQVADVAAQPEEQEQATASVEAQAAEAQPAEGAAEEVRAQAEVIDGDAANIEQSDALTSATDTEPVSESREGGVPGAGEKAAEAARRAGKRIADVAAKVGRDAADAAAKGAKRVHHAVADPDGPVRATARSAGEQMGETVKDASRRNRFVRVGADLAASGAVTSHGGNLSETDGKNIWITRTNSMLGHLEGRDVIKTGWDESEEDAECSRELVVHRAIYHALAQKAADAGEEFAGAAIVHAHTTHTVFRSLIEDEIVPVESESAYVLEHPVKVFAPEVSIGSAEAAQMLAEAVASGDKVGVLRGHGPFAVAEDLTTAERYISVLEQAAKVADLRDATGKAFL